jgi:membrane protein
VSARTFPWTVFADLASFLRFVFRRMGEDRVLQIAGSLAFTTLLALVPLFAIVVATLSRAPFFEQVMVQIKVFILLNLAPEIAGRIITVYMEEFAHNAVRLTALGTAVLFVSALVTLLTVDRSIHAIWREKRSRPLWVSILAYVTLLVVSPVLIAVSVTVTTYLMSLSAQVNPSESAHSFVLQAVPASVSAIAFFLLYRLVPHRHVRGRHAAVGALIACLFFEAAKELFAIYVANVPGYNVLYGAFVAMPFFLMWIYLSWVVVLLGAEVTAALGSWRSRQET